MELSQIRCFLALAETLNFTRAAEVCGITQPSLSRAIKKLEEEVGGILVRRERGHTQLTDMGQLLLPRLQQALSLTDTALSEAQEFARGSSLQITLGVMCTIGPNRLMTLIDHLVHKAPQLDLRMRVATGDRLLDMLMAGEVDIALIGMPGYPEQLHIQPLFTERYMVSIPNGHRFETFESVPMAELSGEHYVERLNCEFDAHYEAKYGEFPYDLTIRFASENEEWVQAMVLTGLGCAILPEYSVFQPDLLTRPLIDPEIMRTVSLATVRGRHHPAGVAMLVRLCQSLKWD